MASGERQLPLRCEGAQSEPGVHRSRKRGDTHDQKPIGRYFEGLALARGRLGAVMERMAQNDFNGGRENSYRHLQSDRPVADCA